MIPPWQQSSGCLGLGFESFTSIAGSAVHFVYEQKLEMALVDVSDVW